MARGRKHYTRARCGQVLLDVFGFGRCTDTNTACDMPIESH